MCVLCHKYTQMSLSEIRIIKKPQVHFPFGLFFKNSLFHFPTQFSTLRVKTATFEHLCYQMVHYPLNGTC